MRNITLILEYDGTNYAGWQVQKIRSTTIQETIEKALQKILQEKVKVIASGRTDAGVHAEEQVANFNTNSRISLKKLHEGLNALLPRDIAVIGLKQVKPGFHSRFHAKSKVYRYTILNRLHRSALLRSRAYFCRYPLNIKLMQKEAKCLLGKHNFKAFQATAKKEKNPIKTITKLRILKDKELIYITIEAGSFLYNMVRNIVGTLIEIGRGRYPEGSMKKILSSRDRRFAGPTAPACGLCLMKVKY